jgi:ferredoxin
MIITKQKKFKDILKYLGPAKSIFLIGCGECSTTCKTGGEAEIGQIKKALERDGRMVTGSCVPTAPCVAAKVKLELAKNKKIIESSEAVLVLACGLGIQSVKENLRSETPVHVGCDTLFMGAIDSAGAFLERCSACGDCVLELTGLICPVTRCPKSLLNGPCGGQNKGKCEVDNIRDCVWILIYNELRKRGRLDLLREIKEPKKHSKIIKPGELKL